MLNIPARTTDYSKLNDTRHNSTSKLSASERAPETLPDTMNFNNTEMEFDQRYGNVYFGI